MKSASSGRAPRLPFVVALLLLALLLPLVAIAQRIPGRTLGVNWHDGVPYLAFSARDLATPEVRKKLMSGLPQTIVMQVAAYRSSDPNTPLAVAPQVSRVTYDFLREAYRVQVQTATSNTTQWIPTLDGVIRRCLVVPEIQVGERPGWIARHGESVTFAVRIEFNPLSQRTVQQIRRWLENSSGGNARGDAFFGSVVSVFVNRRVGDAERSLSFRSQPVRVP